MYLFEILSMRFIFILLIVALPFVGISQDSLKTRTNNVHSSVASLEENETNQNSLLTIQKKIDVYTKNLTRKSFSKAEIEELNSSLDVLKLSDKKSFDYNYLKYILGNYDISLFSYLEKAKKIKPNSPKVIKQMAAYYIVVKDSSRLGIYLQTIFDEEIIPKSLIEYGSDLLMSIPEGGTLITHGTEDTYAVVYLQNNEGFRTDVKVISLELLQSEKYRENLKKRHYILPSSSFIDTAYYNEFLKLNEGRNISTSLTVPKEYFQNSSSNMFVTGIVMRYSSKKIDNLNVNISLWKYDLKYSILNHENDFKSKELSSNYLPMLFQLRTAYRMMNEEEEFKKVDRQIDKIAIFCGKEEMVRQLKIKY